jgi:hypothetical protein
LMKSVLRHGVLVLATACFLAMTSGLVLYLHLSHEEDLLHHDSEHCSLCQAITLNGTKFHIESQPPIILGGQPVQKIVETGVVSPHQFISTVLAPRPPPVFAS